MTWNRLHIQISYQLKEWLLAPWPQKIFARPNRYLFIWLISYQPSPCWSDATWFLCYSPRPTPTWRVGSTAPPQLRQVTTTPLPPLRARGQQHRLEFRPRQPRVSKRSSTRSSVQTPEVTWEVVEDNKKWWCQPLPLPLPGLPQPRPWKLIPTLNNTLFGTALEPPQQVWSQTIFFLFKRRLKVLLRRDFLTIEIFHTCH